MVFGLAWAGQRSFSSIEPRAKAIFAHNSLFFLMPATPIPSVGLEQTQWSEDGKHLLITRSVGTALSSTLEDALRDLAGENHGPNEPGSQIEVFDVDTGRTRVIWQGDRARVGEVETFGKRQFVAVVGRLLSPVGAQKEEVGTTAILIDAASGRWKAVPHYQDLKGSISLDPSPKGNLLLLSFTPFSNSSAEDSNSGPPVATLASPAALEAAPAGNAGVQQGGGPDVVADGGYSDLVNAQGERVRSWPLDVMGSPDWTMDGQSFFWKQVNRKKKTTSYYTLNGDGKIIKLDTPPVPYAEPVKPVDIEPIEVSFAAGDQAKYGRVSGLFIHSYGRKRSRDVLVAAGGKNATVAPTGDAISFEVDHQIKVARILKTTPDLLAQVKDALRKRAMSDAKQAGLALIIYAADFDDQLPLGSMGMDVIMPYIKNQEILDAFNYNPPSSLNMTQIGSPATTPLGFVDGPDGIAVVYADGHAAWLGDDN
jgi:hypothetical protein